MNKKQVLATLALSTIALAQAGYVSADELAPIDSSAPTTEVVTPTAPSASTETEAPATQPTEPSVTPVDPTVPSDKPQGKDNAENLDGVPMISQQHQTNQHLQISHKARTTQEVLTECQLINQHLQIRYRIKIMQVA